VLGASKFPRHWVYDDDGALTSKVGLADFKDWYRDAFGKHTPWGDRDSKALVTAVETALERQLSTLIMRSGTKPEIRTVKKGTALVEQGETGTDLFLVLDGVLGVRVDDEPVAELGPGAILGERAVLEGGTRTASLVATTACRVAVARADQVDRAALEQLAQGHRREQD
ncbi:MAG: cyclic nucleotide-binding domain-containing protein, partial [Acidimicrobiia bacterium]